MKTFLFFLILTQMKLYRSDNISCDFLKENFADATSEFVACAVSNSRPITLCESCVNTYLIIVKSYENMTTSTQNGTHCIDMFVNLDRLQIFDTLYVNSYNLWNNAKCNKCFQFVNGSLTANKSEEALKFEEYYANFTHCILTNDASDIICTKCKDMYYSLNSYYHSISNENEEIATCMDMVDLMNTTRSLWSQSCCKYRQHDEYIFIASTVTVLIVTLCFYVITQFCSVKKSPTILQQRRFAESFNQCSHEEE